MSAHFKCGRKIDTSNVTIVYLVNQVHLETISLRSTCEQLLTISYLLCNKEYIDFFLENFQNPGLFVNSYQFMPHP